MFCEPKPAVFCSRERKSSSVTGGAWLILESFMGWWQSSLQLPLPLIPILHTWLTNKHHPSSCLSLSCGPSFHFLSELASTQSQWSVRGTHFLPRHKLLKLTLKTHPFPQPEKGRPTLWDKVAGNNRKVFPTSRIPPPPSPWGKITSFLLLCTLYHGLFLDTFTLPPKTINHLKAGTHYLAIRTQHILNTKSK